MMKQATAATTTGIVARRRGSEVEADAVVIAYFLCILVLF